MIWPKGTVAGVGVLVFVLGIQTVPLAQTVPEPAPIPETGYVSDSRYVNAFFGFLLPLPQDAGFQDFVLPPLGNSHSIFGVQTQRKGLTALKVSATKSSGNPTDDASKAAAGVKGASVKRVEIGGKEFWKSESEDDSRAGTMHTLIYAIPMSGYTLQFIIVSFDGKLAKELRHSIESITFFDPTQAKVLAGSNARLFPAKAEGVATPTISATHIAQLKLGVVSGNTYTNDTLGFSFQFPSGWVVADKATQDKVVEAGHQLAYGHDPAAGREHEIAQECGRILLSATEHPEGTKTDEVNPLVAIMAFDSACLPGVHLPTSTSDGDAIRQLGVKITRSLSGTPFIGKGKNTIRAFMLQNRMMLDLSSGFTVDVPTRKLPLDVFSSVIFTEDNNYWVMWLFMNGTQSGLDDLRKNIKIAFAPSNSVTDQSKTN
jgi:hypothetical protein